MMRLETIALDAHYNLLPRPGAGTRTHREEQRVTDAAAVVRPAGFVGTVVEIIVHAPENTMPIVILVAGIQCLAFFFGRRPVVVGT